MEVAERKRVPSAITQKAIADSVGVSRRAVAYALNGNGRVGPEMRTRILREAEKMGYSPNPAARALVTGRTNVIAVWTWSLTVPYYALVLQWLEHFIRDAGYEMMVRVIKYDPSQPGGARPMAWPVDGVIALGTEAVAEGYLGSGGGAKPAFVAIGVTESLESTLDRVSIDFSPASRAAVRHLADQGCRRIALMTTPHSCKAGSSRYDAYMEVIHDTNHVPEIIRVDDESRSVCRATFVNYVKAQGAPDGVFCHNDDVALGAYRAVYDLGLRVPEDVAIIGCDGIDDTLYLPSQLTTIEQPVAEVGQRAWELLQNRIANPDAPRRTVSLEAELRVRQSSLKSR